MPGNVCVGVSSCHPGGAPLLRQATDFRWMAFFFDWPGAFKRRRVKKECTTVCSPFARLLQCGRAWTASPNTQEEKRKQAHEMNHRFPRTAVDEAEPRQRAPVVRSAIRVMLCPERAT